MKGIELIEKKVKGKLRKNISLKDYNTWKIGGNAELFFEPLDINDLQIFLSLNNDLDITFLGNGSNVLIRDGGVKGCVICLKNTLKGYKVLKNGEFIFEAGLSCMKIAQITANENFTGLEFLCGIPGSLGGALLMNAGCYDGNIWENISTVNIIDKQGNISCRNKKEFNIGYRNVNIKDNNYFISAKFILQKNKLSNSMEKIKEYLEDRRAKQPTGLPSCGSVFKNPDNAYAANLIDSLGLKGYKIGGAYISEKHANFIISEKNTKSDDIEELIDFIQRKVYQEKNIFLETEVKFIGNKK